MLTRPDSKRVSFLAPSLVCGFAMGYSEEVGRASRALQGQAYAYGALKRPVAVSLRYRVRFEEWETDHLGKGGED